MFKVYNYKVECPNDLKNEILENAKNPSISINWFNFNHNDPYYDDNGKEWHIKAIDHKLKAVTIG